MSRPFVITSGNKVHDKRHAGEECNLDSALASLKVDAEGVRQAIIGNPHLRFCAWCWPEDV